MTSPPPSSPPLPHHLPEPLQLHNAGAELPEGVEQRHDLVPGELQVPRGHSRQQSWPVKLAGEENLESRSQSGYLAVIVTVELHNR